jgi:hypothetical protein
MRTKTRSTKTSATRTTTRAARATRVRRPAAAATSGSAPLGAEERRLLIAQAAYFRAEKRGFAPGGELQDWLAAEAEIDGQLAGQTLVGRRPGHSDT